MAGIANANDISQLKMNPNSTLKATDIHVQEISIEGNTASTGAAEDLLDRVARAAQSAAKSSPATSLSIGAFDADFSGLAAALGDEGPEGPLLREAKKLISDGDHGAALEKLGEVLEIDAHHHEAIYLAAYCQMQQEKISQALKTLLELKDANLNNRLKTRVSSLQAEIRQKTFPRAAKIYAKAVKTKETGDAVNHLREFVDADPGAGKFYFFLAGVLVVGQKMDDARSVALEGLAVCTTDRDELHGFLGQLDQRYMPRLLAPAKKQFRTKKYASARKKLQELDESARSSVLWKTFDGYLERLAGGSSGFLSRLVSKEPAGVEPPGSYEEQQALYEFLVDVELTAARQAIKASDHQKAEQALNGALQLTPVFGRANHMSAACIYRRVGESVKAKVGQDLDEAGAKLFEEYKEELTEARERAMLAYKQKPNKEGKQLIQSIDKMTKEIDTVVGAYERRAHDAKLVNEAVDDFIKVLMSLVTLQASMGNQFQARSTALQLHSNLTRMSKNLPKLKRQCHESEAREIMTKLEEFAQPLLQAVNQAMGR